MSDSARQSGIVRVMHDRDHPYTTINPTFTTDARLTWAARGLLIYLLAKPDNWKVQVKDLVKQAPNAAMLSIVSSKT
jgi:hypothetical protein